jgi:hypothetical protein
VNAASGQFDLNFFKIEKGNQMKKNFKQNRLSSAMGVKSKQGGFSVAAVLGVIGAIAIVAALVYKFSAPSQTLDVTPAKARADAVSLIDALGNARVAYGTLTSQTSLPFAIFGDAQSPTGMNIFTLGTAGVNGTSGNSTISDPTMTANLVRPSFPNGANGNPVVYQYTYPDSNGAVYAVSERNVPSAVCKQMNVALTGSDSAGFPTLGDVPATSTNTSGVMAFTFDSAYMNALVQNQNANNGYCFRNNETDPGVVIAKIA